MRGIILYIRFKVSLKVNNVLTDGLVGPWPCMQMGRVEEKGKDSDTKIK